MAKLMTVVNGVVWLWVAGSILMVVCGVVSFYLSVTSTTTTTTTTTITDVNNPLPPQLRHQGPIQEENGQHLPQQQYQDQLKQQQPEHQHIHAITIILSCLAVLTGVLLLIQGILATLVLCVVDSVERGRRPASQVDPQQAGRSRSNSRRLSSPHTDAASSRHSVPDLQQAERGNSLPQQAEQGSSVPQQADTQQVRRGSRSSMQSAELHHQAEGKSIVEAIQAEIEQAEQGGSVPVVSIQAELEQAERDSRKQTVLTKY